MDRSIAVRTPESVTFNYELAGLGSRFLALVVDQAIQIGLLLIFVAILALTLVPAGGRNAAPAFAHKLAQSGVVALIVVVLFVVFFGYFIIFETVWNGQTPGKRLVGLRVVRDGGFPIDFGASLIRNLIRVGEQIAGYYLVSAISTLLSPENKRLGDFAAGTIVVRDSAIDAATLTRPDDQHAYAPTAYLSGDERALLKRFMERRDSLEPERRDALAASIASRIRERVPPELARLDDESLLERL